MGNEKEKEVENYRSGEVERERACLLLSDSELMIVKSMIIIVNQVSMHTSLLK